MHDGKSTFGLQDRRGLGLCFMRQAKFIFMSSGIKRKATFEQEDWREPSCIQKAKDGRQVMGVLGNGSGRLSQQTPLDNILWSGLSAIAKV